MRTFKIVQKRLYDALSHRHSVLLCIGGLVLTLISAFHFGETALEWSSEKYQAVFNSFRDNIAQRSFQRLLCQYVPIDAVYTWVNGTDPRLLTELFKTRHQLAKELNISTPRDSQCTYSHCVQSHLVLVQPLLPRSITLDDLEDASSLLANVTSVFAIQSTKKDRLQNFTVLVFDSLDSARDAVSKSSFRFRHTNYSMTTAYLTDEWMAHSAVLLEELFVLSGVPPGHSQDDIQQRLEKTVKQVFLYPEKHMAVVSIKSSDFSRNFSLLNLTLDRKHLKILPAYLLLEPLSKDEDASMSRFADNDELKYSLRSLEKNAPWIRHVYLVTNGQIPSWLNLDNPRITVVTHEELFPNISHLPTFSSPAIECHLHRIPGLSEKFLYLNDDVFLGKETWPEDFYSHSRGHKVYLSWPVPDCSEGCPTSWIRDGYCDKTCNNSGCDWDGGDCVGDNVKFSYQQSQGHHRGGHFMFAHQAVFDDVDRMYCNPSCANSWLADRYCDQACNVKSCGFDAGDCGTSSFHNMHQINLEADFCQLPAGEVSAYLNLNSEPFNSSFTVQSGSYEETEAVRVMTVSVKFAILVVVLHHGHGPLNITVSLTTELKRITFTLGIDTRPVSTTTATTTVAPEVTTLEQEIKHSSNLPDRPSADATIYPPDKWFPKMILDDGDELGKENALNISLPTHLEATFSQELERLKSLYESGLLTEKGFKKRQRIRIHDQEQAGKEDRIEPSSDTILTQTEHSETAQARKGFRSLRWIQDQPSISQLRNGFLPWEQDGFLDNILKAEQSTKRRWSYSIDIPVHQRQLLDTFGDSLRHVNRLYNAAFGYEARKVPAHIAHLVDVNLMTRLQARFPEAFSTTSSHKIRNTEDMQFAFSYYYYLMSEMEDVPIETIFDQFDTDQSGSWSDREIRTLLAQINDLPLQFSNVAEFEHSLSNCSQHIDYSKMSRGISLPPDERYADSKLPVVSKSLVVACGPIRFRLLEKFGQRKRNKFEMLGEDEVNN